MIVTWCLQDRRGFQQGGGFWAGEPLITQLVQVLRMSENIEMQRVTILNPILG